MSKRKKKFQIANAVLAGILFLLSGFGFIENGKLLFGIFQIAGGALNLFHGFNLKKQFYKNKNLSLAVGIANIIIPFTIAVDYFQSGAKYIQYVWVLVAVISLVAFIIHIRKSNSIT